jgi:hypothetical protein
MAYMGKAEDQGKGRGLPGLTPGIFRNGTGAGRNPYPRSFEKTAPLFCPNAGAAKPERKSRSGPGCRPGGEKRAHPLDKIVPIIGKPTLILNKPQHMLDNGTDVGHFCCDDGRFFGDDGYFFIHIGHIFFDVERFN